MSPKFSFSGFFGGGEGGEDADADDFRDRVEPEPSGRERTKDIDIDEDFRNRWKRDGRPVRVPNQPASGER